MTRPGTAALGIHVGPDRVHAAWRDAAGRWHTADVPCDGTPAGLTTALAVVATRAPAGVQATVAIAHPHARTRAVEFPRMAPNALVRVLERDWSRYVIAARDVPHAVSVARTGNDWSASFAPRDLLDAIDAAAELHGWRDCATRTVEDALAALAAATRGDRKERAFVVACDDEGARWIVSARNGRAGLARTGAPRSATDVAALAEGTEIVLAGTREARGTMARALGLLGARTRSVASADVVDAPELASLPAQLAALAVITQPTVPLRSARARADADRAMRRLTVALLAGAVAILVAAVAIDTVRIDRALARVRTERAVLAAPVRAALERRGAMEQGAELVRAVAERERTASRTTEILSLVALALPADAVLSRLVVRGDTVLVEGTSTRGGDVYSALRGVALLDGVRLSSPMRQERTAGAPAIDRFAFAAQLRAPAVQR